jgi:hypothetical protein
MNLLKLAEHKKIEKNILYTLKGKEKHHISEMKKCQLKARSNLRSDCFFVELREV